MNFFGIEDISAGRQACTGVELLKSDVRLWGACVFENT